MCESLFLARTYIERELIKLENLDYKLSIVFDNNGSNCKQTKI